MSSISKEIAPASAMVPQGIWSTIESVIESERVSFEASALLSQLSPVLSQVLTHISHLMPQPEKREQALIMLEFILEKAKSCYTHQISPGPTYINPITPVCDLNRSKYEDSIDEAIQTGAFFPGKPYHSVVRDIHFGSENTNCSKQYKHSGRLGAGTLVFWCGIHRKCVGFYLLPSAESCQHVYNILVTRFTTIPRIIIYDNGCNLSEYIFNRAPQMFKDTYILSDGFHWKNHVNCSSAFNSKLYPGLNGKICLPRYFICTS